MKGVLENISFEWWQALLCILMLGFMPIFRALAAVIVGKAVEPEIAKVALPLIFKTRKKTGNRVLSERSLSEE